MSWEINNGGQLITALFSALLGLGLSIIYDFFKAPRLYKKPSALGVFFQDILFSLISTLFTFCLLILYTKGQPRLYVFACMLAGFVLWRVTLSRYLIKFLCLALKFFGSVFDKLSLFCDKCRLKIEKIFKKFYKSLKKGLKGIKLLLYNQLRNFKSARVPNDIRQDDKTYETK